MLKFPLKLMFFTLSLALGLSSAAHAEEFQAVAAGKQHFELLKQGGLVIYMRHGRTDARFPDKIPVELDNCASQRPLSDEGRRQLDQIGQDFAKLELPVHRVITSPFCRAVESAKRVFGDEKLEVDVPLRYTASMPDLEKQPAVERTRYWISLPVVAAGSNRVVVAHGPNVAEIMDYLPGEATLVIFRPLGTEHPSGFEYIASIAPDHWPVLLDELGLTDADESHP